MKIKKKQHFPLCDMAKKLYLKKKTVLLELNNGMRPRYSTEDSLSLVNSVWLAWM